MPENKVGTVKTAADQAIAFALSQIGKPYRLGANGPDEWDCSSLVQASYRSAGVSISRTTYTQINDGVAVDPADIRPGDLRFPDPGHVQLYLGNNEIVEAPNPSKPVQRVTAWGPAWKVRRVAPPGTAPGTSTNPVDATNNIIPASLTDTLSKMGAALDPKFWGRQLVGFAGFLLVLIALIGILFTGGQIKSGVGKVANAARTK